MFDSPAKCNICNKEYTSMHAEVTPGINVYVCQNCLEKAKDNFIWICMNCGRSYIRPKKMVISRLKDLELKRAYLLCEDEIMIQGIDACITCEPETILAYMDHEHSAAEC